MQVERLRAHDQLHIHLLRRQGVDQVNEGASRDCDRTFFLYLGSNPARDPHLQIGGGEFEPPGVGGQEYVTKHRERGTRGNRSPNYAQAFRQVFLQASNLHKFSLLKV
ncbi:MAG: hypothetical protein DRI48_11585 [Chloroflexi bacterium]|nr:MAG: hypothetical protein DRI48_11585 [Chloroflexota bacterium]